MSRVVFSLILVIVAFAVMLFTTVYEAIKLKSRNRELLQEVEKKNNVVSYMYTHSQEIADLYKEKAKIDIGITETKTDEEIAEIISAIVTSNNERVHNDKK